MQRHLALDIGGVFYRGWPADGFWPVWSARTGRSRAELEDFLSHAPEAQLARLGKITAAEYYSRCGGRLQVEPMLLRQLAEAAYISEFDERLAAFVRAQRADGLRIAGLTNSLSSEAEIMTRPEFAGVFHLVVSSRDVGAAKPDAAIYLRLLERLQAQPSEVVFVDDSPVHVEAAHALGLTTVHFRSTEQAIAEVASALVA